MQDLLLISRIRNCSNERGLRLLIALVPLHLGNAISAKLYRDANFSTVTPSSTGQFRVPTKSSGNEMLANNIPVGSGKGETLRPLVHDEAGVVVNISHSLVDTLLHHFKDDWKSAWGIFRWADTPAHFEQLPEAYDLMVDILGKARQFDKMRELVGEMRARNLVTLNTVAKMMRRFSGARRWKDAVRMFDELGSFGLEKNAESMNLLLDTLCKESQVEMARSVFLELKSHIPPTAHTFNIFIHGWCKINRVEESYWTLQEMKGTGIAPCVISYSTIIKSYCQKYNWGRVYELLEVMEAQGCQPSVVTYTTIMCSLAKAGQFEEALQIADRVKSAGYKPDTQFYNALINTLGKAERLREAIHVLKVEMRTNGISPNTCTYNTLIATFCQHGQEQMALGILEEMEKSALCKPDVQTFYPLLKACFKLGKTDGYLRKLLDDMTIKHHLSLDVSTYTLLIHSLCRVDKCKWAYDFFEEMIGKELTPRYQTCRLLLDEVKQKSMYDAADRVEHYIKYLKTSQQQRFPGSRVNIVASGE